MMPPGIRTTAPSLGRFARKRGLALAVAAVLAAPAPAMADPGDHIRAGDDAVFTPKILLGLEYNTNAYRAESQVRGAVNLMVSPGLDLMVETKDLTFSLGGAYEIRSFFGQSRNLSKYDAFHLNADLRAFPEGQLGLRLREGLALTNIALEEPNSPDPFQTELRSTTDGQIVIAPAKTLAILPGARFGYYNVKATQYGNDIASRQFNDQIFYGPRLDAEWKFFPRTALVLAGSYEIHDWTLNAILAPDATGTFGTTITVPDNKQLRLSGGLRGRLTRHAVVQVQAGYASGNFSEKSVADAGFGADDPNASYAIDLKGAQKLTVDSQIRYEFSKDTRVTLGYQRDFREAYFTNFTQYDYGFGRFDGLFAKRVGVVAELGSRLERYRGLINRNDTMVVARGDLTWNFQEWASLTGGVTYTQRLSTDPLVNFANLNAHVLTSVSY